MKSRSYNTDHCWQYDIRLKNKEADISAAIQKLKYPSSLLDEPFLSSEEGLQSLSVSDFALSCEDKNQVWAEAKAFIETHEWLGKVSLYPTHIFTARYRGLLCGVVIMDMPNAFSKMLGEDTRKVERLISRGACISFSPKNLASSLIMFSVRWMAANTQYRLFTAYSDPEARELGTIYQACNFHYLGNKSGAKSMYQLPSGNWVSDRHFRSRSVYKTLAASLGIQWEDEWQDKEKLHWEAMPRNVEESLRAASKALQAASPSRVATPKHKYAIVMGRDRRETKALNKEFLARNSVLPYPKERGL